MASNEESKNRVEFVDFKEGISITVGNWLQERGYKLADSVGVEMRRLTAIEEIGVLYQDPKVKPNKHLGGLIKTKPRKRFLGTIWFQNSRRGANEKNWVFEIQGREYAEMLKQLAEEMASTFHVKISVRLMSEKPVFETYLSDFC